MTKKKKVSKTLQVKKDVRIIYVISSKKFESLALAEAQMWDWELNAVLDRKATIYEVKRVIKYKRNAVKVKKLRSNL